MSLSARSRGNMLVGQLLTNKVLDAALLSAVADVPREMYVSEALRGVAYVDEDIEVAPGRYLLEPLALTRLLQLARIASGDAVLDVGCCTGYSTAVMSRLAAHVYAVEQDRQLADIARQTVRKQGIKNAQIVNALHVQGYSHAAPYDVILLNGASQNGVESLVGQLKVGGRIVFVKNVASRPGEAVGLGRAVVGLKSASGVAYKEYFDVSVPVLPGFGAIAGFNF